MQLETTTEALGHILRVQMTRFPCALAISASPEDGRGSQKGFFCWSLFEQKFFSFLKIDLSLWWQKKIKGAHIMNEAKSVKFYIYVIAPYDHHQMKILRDFFKSLFENMQIIFPIRYHPSFSIRKTRFTKKSANEIFFQNAHHFWCNNCT